MSEEQKPIDPQNSKAQLTNNENKETDQTPLPEQLTGNGLPGEDALLQKGEITNNDGSVVETLDTAFHDKPGMIKGHSIAGSNRADYYEAQSGGKSDSEEEMEYLRNKKDK